MKYLISMLLAISLLPAVAEARDAIDDYSLNEVLQLKKANEVLGQDMLFFFGAEAHGEVQQTFGEIRTSKKTNAFGKSDLKACQWAFLGAMKSLKQRAEQMGANAIINIKSNYKNQMSSSDETFKCGAGTAIAGVALVGTAVKLGN